MLCDITQYHAVTLGVLSNSVASWQLCFGSEGRVSYAIACAVRLLQVLTVSTALYPNKLTHW